MKAPAPMTAPDEYAVLVAAMDEFRPRCRGDVRFTTDLLSRTNVDQMRRVCAGCAIRSACSEFARAAQPSAGFWAGRDHSRKQKEIST